MRKKPATPPPRQRLTPDLLDRFLKLLEGLPRWEGGLAHRAWNNPDLPVEDVFLPRRRRLLESTLRLLDRRGAVDFAGALQDLIALKNRVLLWTIRGGHEDPRLPNQPDLWRDLYGERDAVIRFLKPRLPSLRKNPLLSANKAAIRTGTDWVSAFRRYLKHDPRATCPAPPPRRGQAGRPSLPTLREGRRLLGRRGVPHGHRDALLMTVGVIPYRE